MDAERSVSRIVFDDYYEVTLLSFVAGAVQALLLYLCVTIVRMINAPVLNYGALVTSSKFGVLYDVVCKSQTSAVRPDFARQVVSMDKLYSTETRTCLKFRVGCRLLVTLGFTTLLSFYTPIALAMTYVELLVVPPSAETIEAFASKALGVNSTALFREPDFKWDEALSVAGGARVEIKQFDSLEEHLDVYKNELEAKCNIDTRSFNDNDLCVDSVMVDYSDIGSTNVGGFVNVRAVQGTVMKPFITVRVPLVSSKITERFIERALKPYILAPVRRARYTQARAIIANGSHYHYIEAQQYTGDVTFGHDTDDGGVLLPGTIHIDHFTYESGLEAYKKNSETVLKNASCSFDITNPFGDLTRAITHVILATEINTTLNGPDDLRLFFNMLVKWPIRCGDYRGVFSSVVRVGPQRGIDESVPWSAYPIVDYAITLFQLYGAVALENIVYCAGGCGTEGTSTYGFACGRSVDRCDIKLRHEFESANPEITRAWIALNAQFMSAETEHTPDKIAWGPGEMRRRLLRWPKDLNLSGFGSSILEVQDDVVVYTAYLFIAATSLPVFFAYACARNRLNVLVQGDALTVISALVSGPANCRGLASHDPYSVELLSNGSHTALVSRGYMISKRVEKGDYNKIVVYSEDNAEDRGDTFVY